MDMKQSKRKNIRQERKKVGLVFPNIVLCVCVCICTNKTIRSLNLGFYLSTYFA